MCNAPKFGDLEERTGYGGGFNEREGVEYIQRDESDDEFDEFGQEKKKFRNKTQSLSEEKKDPPENLPTWKRLKTKMRRMMASLKYDIWGSEEEDKDESKNDKKKNGGSSDSLTKSYSI
ncbi:Zinc finger Ran-binding domain-containing protein 2 [Halocaridina rubra]|uniref:Zinc finger Ran-binding domain-containing protein 2 n=1 Tax=Halocaridina rubra TaxID=373956 RepID=A0AAN8WJT5_HALRR